MNLTDLTEVLRDRAELGDSSHEARMAGVRARVSATRRRRAVAGVTAVVVALVGIVYATLPRPEQRPEPAVAPRSLPEYQNGTRLITQAWGDLPATTVTVRFVPKSLNLWIFQQCDIGPNDHLLVSMTVNGHRTTERSTCGGASRPQDWSSVGVVPGQQSEITLTVDGIQGESESGPPPALPLPASGTFALGVGEGVPVSEYPFPPRPQTLETFPLHLPAPVIELSSNLANPLERKEFSVQWPGNNVMAARMNTPGRMRVLVNDVQVIDYSSWNYTPGGEQIEPADWKAAYGLDVAEGQTVKITVIPERITGEWKVTLATRGR